MGLEEGDMKRLIAVVLISILCSALFSADTERHMKSFRIQAGVGEKVSINVERIPAQTTSYVAGMPFNIEESFVEYTNVAYQGRLIANFDILSNTKFDLEIKAEPMTHTTLSSAELDYYLIFDYRLGYQTAGGISNSIPKRFTFHSANPADWIWSDQVNADVLAGTYIGSVDGSIYFKFDSASTSEIQAEKGNNDGDLPAGNYSATVTITIKTDAYSGGNV